MAEDQDRPLAVLLHGLQQAFPFRMALATALGFLMQTPARPSMVPTFLILVAVEVASFLAGASLADLGQ